MCHDICPIYDEKRCCRYCTDQETCNQSCLEPYATGESDDCTHLEDDGVTLTALEEKTLPIMKTIHYLVSQKKVLEQQEKQMKDKLKEAMEAAGVKQFENPLMKVTYIGQSTTTSVDTAKLKKRFPNVYEECQKTVNRSAYVKVEVKEDGC